MTTIRIQLFSPDQPKPLTYDLKTANDIEVEHATTTALVKLLRHSWAVRPGDVIRINEV